MKELSQFTLWGLFFWGGILTKAWAFNNFFLCGSDEDGCYDYRSCACIPFHETDKNRLFCLDLDKTTCEPFSKTGDCYPLFTYKNKKECLAMLFQSSTRAACAEVEEAFCLSHHIALCDSNGQFSSCK